jgi:hypothetical protein
LAPSSSNISSTCRAKGGRCSIRSANLGPGLARPPAPTAGAFFSVSSWPPPTVSCYRTCAADRTATRQWQRRGSKPWGACDCVLSSVTVKRRKSWLLAASALASSSLGYRDQRWQRTNAGHSGSGLPMRGNGERGVDNAELGPATSDPIGIRTFSFLHAPIFVTYTGPALRQQHRRWIPPDRSRPRAINSSPNGRDHRVQNLAGQT